MAMKILDAFLPKARFLWVAFKSRAIAVLLWGLCTVALPVLWVMQLMQALFGSVDRSIRMAVAHDQCGNALFGGIPTMTISARTGLALREGKRWARIVAPVIDFFFGEGHCAGEALGFGDGAGRCGRCG